MKSFFLVAWLGLAAPVCLSAQKKQMDDAPRHLEEIPGYAELISNRQVLLVYDPQTPVETWKNWLKSPLFDAKQAGQPLAPGRFLARMAPGIGWRRVADAFNGIPGMQSVTPWLVDKSGNPRGILPQLYVKLKSADDEAYLRTLATRYGAVWSGERTDMPGIWEMEMSDRAGSAFNAWEMALFLNRQPGIEFADANFAFFPRVHTVDDSLYSRQWALQNVGGSAQWNGTPGADLDVVNAWQITTGDSSVRVAILDSGVDTLHPDLAPNLLPGYDATGNGSKGYPNTHFPSDGHGTACAGIVGAKGNNHIGVAGIAYDCKILPVKVFYYIDTTVIIPGIVDTTLHEIPYSETAYLLNGINWAWQTGQADVLSNSWGIPPALLPLAPISQPVVSQAIQNAAQQGRDGKGAIPLFSSGNDNGALIWPANSPNLISVGATTNKDKRASFSNYGTGLDVAAPGVQITTTDMLGTQGFAAGDYSLDFGGTSAACPYAAGVAALVLSEYPALTFTEVRSTLRVSAERVGGYTYTGTGTADGTWSQQLGYGRLNAYQALLAPPVLSVQNVPGASVSVFPNPASSQTTLWIKGLPDTRLQYEVLDITGKKVMEGRFFSVSEEQAFPLSTETLPAGLYHIRLGDGNTHFNVKFIKN